MTLHIIHSNKVERLHDELCYLLKNNPLSNPFDVETIVCPSKAMARWIHIRFTQKMGIAAHYEYPMPSSWVWHLAGQCLPNIPEQDPLQRDLLSWRIFHYLDDINDSELFAPIHHYLKNDEDSTKRWSLAKKIAFVFERYQHFRPDLIKQWNKGHNHEWQGMLWQVLTDSIETDRVKLLQQLGLFLSAHQSLENIPQRAIFFSVSALPPLLFKNIQALAEHTEVYFFVLSPSEHYWSDLVSLKQQAKQRLNNPELNDYFTTGHELLASWGRQGQVFQDMLLYELDDSITQHHDIYDDDFSPNILNQLQKSLYDLSDEVISIKADDSIRFNLCHSPLRECEVLHDQCLALLENKELVPEDILVIVPNMEQYALTIEAVFKKLPDQKNVKPFIPWNLSDSSLHAENPLIRTFLNALTLPSSRFTVTDILVFLDSPEVLQRFKLVEEDKVVIRDYVQQAHVYWGFDASHKADFNVPEMLQNTWFQAQQRFFSSYAIDESIQHENTAPLQGFSSSRGLVIAQFMQLLDTLNNWRHKLSYKRSVEQWQKDLNDCIDALFLSDDEASFQIIRDAIDELVTQSSSDHLKKNIKLKRELMSQWLNDYFEESQNNQRFFSGGITFCGMRPMRSVPFKVIVMLGMNENEFPRQKKPIEFDLMVEKWRPGDLLISDEDRYLFLEAILCARETLIISYCANSLKDNADKEPSNLVSEFCDYIDGHFKSDQTDSHLSKQLSTQYAMHSFSSNNYNGHYQSYNHFWCEVAQKIQNKKESDKAVLNSISSIALDIDSDVELMSLITCLKDPLKFYFNSQLNIRLYDEQGADDDERFELDALQKWILKDQLMKAQLAQKEESMSTITAQAVLPHGAHASACYDSIETELKEQMSELHDYLNKIPLTIAVDIPLTHDVRLKGKVINYYPSLGQLFITPSNFGSKPFIECWLNHCVLCALEQLNGEEMSILNCKNKTLHFKILPKNIAEQYLIDMVNLMHTASKQPLIILPKSSFVYQYTVLFKDEEKALNEVLLKWHGNDRNEASKGEKENDYMLLMYQQFYSEPQELFESIAFKEMAQLMYGNAFKHCEFEVE